ncbi:MAG: alpha-mannosidase, partial [Chloroflexi bacterium]|nr:alpha-mannosidase [Chloroflexota bacterium]
PYPCNLNRAWKDVLFNQFHDILAGTSIKPAYDDARNEFGEALAIAGRALNNATQSLAWHIRTNDLKPIVVFNPHAWQSQMNVELEFGRVNDDDVLYDDEGNTVPLQLVQSYATAGGRNRLSFVADLPPLGYRTYRIASATADGRQRSGALARQTAVSNPSSTNSTDTVLENEYLRLEINPATGYIQSLRDKRCNVDVFLSAAAKPVVLDDPSDTWGHNVFKFDRVIGAFTAQSVRLVEHGSVKSVIRVVSAYGASQLIQDFVMYADLNQIDVRVTVDWREQFKLLKLRFPINLNFMQATYEIPYGHIVREANGEEEPGQSWIDVTGVSRDSGELYGLSILNDGKYSFDVNVRDIGLTVLRSPIYAHHDPMIPQAHRQYSFIDQGIQHFTYTLLPHAGGWEQAGTVRRAAELNQRPITLIGSPHPNGTLPQQLSFASAEPDNIMLTALK